MALGKDSFIPQEVTVLQHVFTSLQQFEANLEKNAKAFKDPLPSPAKKWYRLCYYGLGAQCQHRMGNADLALELASLFLSKVQLQKFEDCLGMYI